MFFLGIQINNDKQNDLGGISIIHKFKDSCLKQYLIALKSIIQMNVGTVLSFRNRLK